MTRTSVSRAFSSTRVVGIFMPSEIFWAKEKFRVSDKQNVPVNFRLVNDRFLYHFGMFPHMVEQRVVLLNGSDLAAEFTSTQDMFDAVGGPDNESSFVTVPEAYALLLAHANGRENVLSTTSGNIFFLQGRRGMNWILIFSWSNNLGWMVTFCEGLIPHNWLRDTRVFSRHKFERAV